MKRLIMCSLLASAIICSCTPSKTSDSKTYFLDTSAQQDYNLSDVVESVDMLFLNETDEVMVGKVCDVKYAANRWYLLDIDEGRSVVSTFDDKGNPLNIINRMGRGPKEYLELAGFDVCPKTGDLYLCCYPPKVMVFDKDLNFKSESAFENPYFSVAKCDDGLMLYGFTSRDSVGVDYVKFDGSDKPMVKPIKRWLRDSNVAEVMGENSFMRTRKNIYFHTRHCDSLYRIDGTSLSLVAAIDYPNREAIKEYRENHSIYDLPMAERGKYSLPRVISVMERGDERWLQYSKVLFGFIVDSPEGVKNYDAKFLAGTSVCCDGRLVDVMESFRYNSETFDPQGWLQGVKVNHVELTDKQRESGNKILLVYNLRD